MGFSLSRYEMEVVIQFNAEGDRATLYTAYPKWIRKLDKLCKANPDAFTLDKVGKVDGQIVSKQYTFPKKLVSIRSGLRSATATDDTQQDEAEDVDEADKEELFVQLQF